MDDKVEISLIFRPIDLTAHRAVAIRFCKDAHLCSFGHIDRFKADEYKAWLEKRMEQDPWAGVHIWFQGEIIGQMELGSYRVDPSIGYVNLYYLIPELRGTQISPKLDEFAVQHLRKQGYRRAYLSVSPTNARAHRYYQRLGWRDLGPRPEDPAVHLMERML